jgi:CRP/FNR family cyclic AMP-dependent transcriptional regulator
MEATVTKLWQVDSIQLFEGLTYEDKLKIEKMVNTKTYSKNAYIYKIDDASNDIHFVVSGRVKVANNSNHGKENIKWIIYEGDVFGEMGVLDEECFDKRRDYAQTMEDETVICTISYDSMRQLMRDYPVLQKRLIKKVSRRLRRTENRLEAIMFKDARTRLVDFIKDLAKDLGKPVGHEVLVKHRLTHQEIANITAISRQKVTTLLNELKQENLIHLERKSLLIRDMNVLK